MPANQQIANVAAQRRDLLRPLERWFGVTTTVPWHLGLQRCLEQFNILHRDFASSFNDKI